MLNKEPNLIYFDPQIEDYSNISVGFLIKYIGAGKKVAYIDTKDSATKLSNLIENLSLSYSFTKSLHNFHIDIYKLKPNEKVSKTIIPLVEFCTITKDIFYNSLQNYSAIIIDNLDLKDINKIKLISILKNTNIQVIITTKNKKDFDELKPEFNFKYICDYDKKSNLIANKDIINICGEGKGKTCYSIGNLIRNFINKKDVKLIYFDKGDNIYSDAIFFNSLKFWSRENKIYGSFDFVKTGIKRQFNEKTREEISPQDINEAKEALMLLKTSLKKQSPVIADELNTIVEKKILDPEEVLAIIKEVKQELIITGNTTNKKILDIAKSTINIHETE